MQVGIVILNWNGRKLLEKYLPSVMEHSTGHTVYVADNGSTDDSIIWLKDTYPQINILQMPTNQGYAGGYNQALTQVTEELVCLLNNDVAVTPHWIEPMISLFQEHPALAAAQPMLLSDLDRNKYDYAGAAGGFLDSFAYPYCKGRIFHHIENLEPTYTTDLQLDWASGAALFVKKSLFFEVGGFDTTYFAHQEEIDLCWRLRHAGYQIGVSHLSKVFHLGGGTLSAFDPKKSFYNFRNSLFNIVKNDHRNYWWGILLIRMLLDGIAGLRFLAKFQGAHFLSILKAHGSFYKGLPAAYTRRKQIKKTSKISITHYSVQSIVMHYFIKGKKTFKQL